MGSAYETDLRAGDHYEDFMKEYYCFPLWAAYKLLKMKGLVVIKCGDQTIGGCRYFASLVTVVSRISVSGYERLISY